MQKGLEMWRRLSGIGKAFLCSALLYAILALIGRLPFAQSLAGLASVVLALLLLFQLARRAMRQAIWRLRNRLLSLTLPTRVVRIGALVDHYSETVAALLNCVYALGPCR